MEYAVTHGEPISEKDALALVTEMGFHGYAFDQSIVVDETLHWHEFAAVTWVISGSGALINQDGERIEIGPGCRLEAPAGYLHRALAGDPLRLVIGTDLPYEQWTKPIDKDPADRPASLAS